MAVWRGEVYYADLSPTIGREQKGRRPVLVVSRDSLNNLPLVVAVVPGTRGSHVRTDYPQNVRVPVGEANLPDETVFLTFHIRAVDHSRLRGPLLGKLSPSMMDKIDEALAWTLALVTGSSGTP
jgi:mRNA interferase MazF